MRLRRYLIPIVFFLLSVPAGRVLTVMHERAIADLINRAGSQGQPIVLMRLVREVPYLRWHFLELWLYTIDGRSIRLGEERELSSRDLALRMFFFDDDGTLYASGYSQTTYRFQIWKAELPDARFRFVSEGCPEFDVQGDFLGYGERPNTIESLAVFKDRFQIIDPFEQVVHEHEFINSTPWEQADLPQPIECRFVLSPDRSTIYASGRADSGTAAGPSAIWRYDIRHDAWTEIGTLQGRVNSISTSPDGRILAVRHELQRYREEMTVFEGPTNSPFVVQGATSLPVIGRRWAAAKIWGPLRNEMLCVYELEDHWLQHAITLPSNYALPYYYDEGMIFLYEPPPDGIDGMFENYHPSETPPPPS